LARDGYRGRKFGEREPLQCVRVRWTRVTIAEVAPLNLALLCDCDGWQRRAMKPRYDDSPAEKKPR
jgi:hypothetical protein